MLGVLTVLMTSAMACHLGVHFLGQQFQSPTGHRHVFQCRQCCQCFFGNQSFSSWVIDFSQAHTQYDTQSNRVSTRCPSFGQLLWFQGRGGCKRFTKPGQILEPRGDHVLDAKPSCQGQTRPFHSFSSNHTSSTYSSPAWCSGCPRLFSSSPRRSKTPPSRSRISRTGTNDRTPVVWVHWLGGRDFLHLLTGKLWVAEEFSHPNTGCFL